MKEERYVDLVENSPEASKAFVDISDLLLWDHILHKMPNIQELGEYCERVVALYVLEPPVLCQSFMYSSLAYCTQEKMRGANNSVKHPFNHVSGTNFVEAPLPTSERIAVVNRG
jgi:hypothetical protein